MSDLNIKGPGQWSDQGHLCLRGMDTLIKESTLLNLFCLASERGHLPKRGLLKKKKKEFAPGRYLFRRDFKCR